MIAVVAASVLAVAGCSSAPPTDPAPSAVAADTILAPYDLAGQDGRAVVDQLDRLPTAQRPGDLRASVRPGRLLLSDAGTGAQAELALPADLFYLSIAPYVDSTHECYFHSLTTCRGELGGQPLTVRITDRATGAVLVDETVTAFDNGFAGFWLPAGIEATLRVTHAAGTAEQEIRTGPEDPTCVTTLRLS
jgi:hypothetical protein